MSQAAADASTSDLRNSPTPVLIVGNSDVALWHLSAAERLRRQIGAEPTLIACETQDQPGVATAQSRIMRVSGRFLFDGTVLREFAKHDNAVLVDPHSNRVAAVITDAAAASVANQLLDNVLLPAATLEALTPADLHVYNDDLRHSSTPTLARLTVDRIDELESLLYGASYKGITDLVTKWVWPRPARLGVRFCARYGITPNHVTLCSVVLMFAALWAFASGYFALGLLAGWLMTWLDTVDGKLARVTVRSSRIGHVLDHGMDLLHPPFWYLAWTQALATNAPIFDWITQGTLLQLIFYGYIGGRLVEAAFHGLGQCGLFSWRPFDACFRLITGRRNPCLILLTLGWVLGRPDLGLLWVALWTAISSVIMLGRLFYAIGVRLRHGPLRSWLASTDAAARHPRAFAMFATTRGAYRVSGGARGQSAQRAPER